MEERRVPLTLILGLGGTGQLVARHVKAIIQRELNVQDFSEVPFVEVMVLDTTEQMSLGDRSEASVLSADEFSDLGGFNLQSILAHREEYPELSWFPRNRYLPGELTLGAGGIRHVGRLCYAVRRDGRMVYGRLSEKIRRLSAPQVEEREFYYFKELIRPRLRSGLQIHIVGSCAGGTGGGMFLPAAYDVRDWAERITGKDPVVMGHLLLPEAFAMSEARQASFRRNAFAVLAELNHFFKTGRWEAQYRDEKQVISMIPFNFLYLINAGRQDGSLQVREDLCREIGRFIALLALGKEGESYRTAAINLWEGCLALRDQFAEPMVFCSYGAGFRDLSRGALKDYFNVRLMEFLENTGVDTAVVPEELVSDLRQNILERLDEESARHVQSAGVEMAPFHSILGRKAMVDLPEIVSDITGHQELLNKARRDATDGWRSDLEGALRTEWDIYNAQLTKYFGRQGVPPAFLRAFLVAAIKAIQDLRELRTLTSDETKVLASEAEFFEEIRRQERDDSEMVQRVEIWSRADRVHLRDQHLKIERQELQNFTRDLQERLDRQTTLTMKKDFAVRLDLRSAETTEYSAQRTGGFYRMSDVPAEVAEAMERALKRFASSLFLGLATSKLLETCLALSNEVREAFQEESRAYFGQQGTLMPGLIVRQRLSEMDSQVQVNWSLEGEQSNVERIRRIGCPRNSEIEPFVEPEAELCATDGYGHVTMVKVDHGAPLHHLRWVKDYLSDFVRNAFSNQRRRASEEWLSSSWYVSNPVPGPDSEVFEFFGLAARLGFVVAQPDGTYRIVGLGDGADEGVHKGRAGAFRAFRKIFQESYRTVRETILLELRSRHRNREIPGILEGWARDAFRLSGAHGDEEDVDSLGGEDARIAWNEASGIDRFLRLGKWGLGELAEAAPEEAME